MRKEWKLPALGKFGSLSNLTQALDPRGTSDLLVGPGSIIIAVGNLSNDACLVGDKLIAIKGCTY